MSHHPSRTHELNNARFLSWDNSLSAQLYGHSSLTGLETTRHGLIVSSRDGFLRRFTPGEAAVVDQWKIGTPLHSVTANAEGNLAACGTLDGRVVLLRLPDGQVVAETTAHSDIVTAVSFSAADSQLLASGGRDGKIRLWRCRDEGFQPILTLMIPKHRPINDIQFSPDGTRLAAIVQAETAVRIWNVKELRAKLGELGIGW